MLKTFVVPDHPEWPTIDVAEIVKEQTQPAGCTPEHTFIDMPWYEDYERRVRQVKALPPCTKCIKIAGFDIPKESCSRRWYETPNNWIGHQLRARTWKPNLKF